MKFPGNHIDKESHSMLLLFPGNYRTVGEPIHEGGSTA
jgi:hypothetical protein